MGSDCDEILASPVELRHYPSRPVLGKTLASVSAAQRFQTACNNHSQLPQTRGRSKGHRPLAGPGQSPGLLARSEQSFRAVFAHAGALTVLFLLVSLAGCGRQDDVSRASHGSIDRHAPVQTTVQITIRASPVVVWKALSDIAHWPAWQPDIQTTTIAAPAAAGVPFDWTTSGATIHSQIALYEPEHRLSWTGHLLIFRAIHVWELASLPNGQTSVTTTESLSGWPIGWFYSSSDLRQADQRWLTALKREAEQMTEPGRARPD